MLSYIKRVFQRIKSLQEGRTATLYKISHDPNGLILNYLTIENDSGKKSFVWADVIKVTTFIRDLLTVDLICISFALSNNTTFEINEEMEGWDDLTKHLPEYLPGCKKWEEWFMEVFSPAFELNASDIYVRK